MSRQTNLDDYLKKKNVDNNTKKIKKDPPKKRH